VGSKVSGKRLLWQKIELRHILNVKIVKKETTHRFLQKRERWVLYDAKNFVGSVVSTIRTKRRSKWLERPVALTVERQTPNLKVGGSNPSWPASTTKVLGNEEYRNVSKRGSLRDDSR
jgi:hypothetical protein